MSAKPCFFKKKVMLFLSYMFRNGEDWYTLRKSVQKLMMHPRAAAKYLDAQSEVADDFVDIIKLKCRSDGEVEGFYDLLLQYTMECKQSFITVLNFSTCPAYHHNYRHLVNFLRGFFRP